MDDPSLQNVESQTSHPRLKAIGTVLGVSLLAMILGDLLSVLPHLQAEGTSGTAGIVWFGSALALSFVGMALAGFVYLHMSKRGISYIDLQRPSGESVKYTVIGVVGLIGALIGFNALILALDIPVAESLIVHEIENEPQLALVFLVIVFFFNAPAEEFLFRNVVQKRLNEVFSLGSAVVITSVIFAVLHLPGYLIVASMVESMAPLLMIFVASLVFGALYGKTEDLGVVIAVHAIFNAVQILPFLIAA